MENHIPVHIEICLNPHTTVSEEEIEQQLSSYLYKNQTIFTEGSLDISSEPFLQEHVESVRIVDMDEDLDGVLYWQASIQMHTFHLDEEGPAEEMTQEGEENADSSIPACSQWVLPARDFHGLWESLYYDTQIKTQLLDYATTAMLFSDRGVDTNLVNWNRVVLLHGPPGTGKTSLCKALAHKLAIRLSSRYPYGQLLEINSHSLFSKWFSESGKLVMKLFKRINELVEDQESLVCVLIDEVESLTSARKAAVSGSEPSDAIRVVNALLTQIDQLKQYPNVLILTTSNITEAIDLAFVDRADIKQYIGPPSERARYEIIHSCLQELCRVGIISSNTEIPSYTSDSALNNSHSIRLKQISNICEGFSGRYLRKVPFLAHAKYIKATDSVSMSSFLEALEKAAQQERHDRSQLPSGDK